MNRPSFAYIRVSAAALAAALLLVRGTARVGAQSSITITSPANGAVLAAGPDFATDAWADPWDFNNREDVAVDPMQFDGFSNFHVGGGVAGGTITTSRVGASNGSNFSLLQRPYYGIVNPGRTGGTSPINSAAYTKLAFKMTSSRSDQYPRVYWFHNQLGSPAGDGSGWRFVDSATAAPSGSHIFVVDLTQANQGTPWTSGAVQGLALYPNSSATGYDVSVDWVRLTTADGNGSSKVLPIAWSGGSGAATIQVRDAAGAVFTVASGLAGTSYNWNYGVLPPGSYTLTVTRGGVASTARSFRINTPPTLQVLDPDASGGDDFATTVLGNPWDMQDAADVEANGTIVDHVISRSFSGGLYNGVSDSAIVGYAGSVPMGDPQMYLLSNSTAANTHDVIDTSRYHRLTFSLQVDHGFDLGAGSVARVFWGAATGGGAPYTNLSVTKDIITWPGMNTYSIDLATLSGAAGGGLEPGSATPWTAAKVRHLRIDPFELAGQIPFHFGAVKLAADDETKNGSFTIRFSGADADGDAATVALYYDTDRNSANGLTPIASGVPLANRQYVWNAGSVPQGTYYIYAVASDGRNTTAQYSTGPVHVSGFVGAASQPVLSIDTPGNGATGGGQFTVAGWAIDLGAAGGTGIDAIDAYADPGTAQETLLGHAKLGTARADVAAAYGAQFSNSGYSIAVGSLSGGRHTIAVYAHSTVSNGNTVKSFTYTVSGGPAMAIDTPGSNGVCQQPCPLSGWALDTAAGSGTGVDAVHVYAVPAGGAARFVGAAQLGGSRPDVGAAFGSSRFSSSGFQLIVRGLPPGTYQLLAFAHSTATGSFNDSRAIANVTVRSAPRMSIDAPAANSTVGTGGFTVSGWAVDAAAASGPGVDAVHIYAFPVGSSTPRFLGAATLGVSRSDVGALFGGSQFTKSGYNLKVTGLSAGTYDLAVCARSSVSGEFDDILTVRVVLR